MVVTLGSQEIGTSANCVLTYQAGSGTQKRSFQTSTFSFHMVTFLAPSICHLSLIFIVRPWALLHANIPISFAEFTTYDGHVVPQSMMGSQIVKLQLPMTCFRLPSLTSSTLDMICSWSNLIWSKHFVIFLYIPLTSLFLALGGLELFSMKSFLPLELDLLLIFSTSLQKPFIGFYNIIFHHLSATTWMISCRSLHLKPLLILFMLHLNGHMHWLIHLVYVSRIPK